jgi:hypothetical protein
MMRMASGFHEDTLKSNKKTPGVAGSKLIAVDEYYWWREHWYS